MASSCCPPGGWPALEQEATYKEQGGVRELPMAAESGWGEEKLSVYEVGPRDAAAGVVLVYDVFGFKGGRVRGVCDQLSELLGGGRVILADIYGGARSIADFGGFEAPEGQAFLKEAGAWNTRARWALQAAIAALKEGNAGMKIGAYGFCYGAYPMMMGCAGDFGLSAGAAAHPSFQVAGLFGDNLTEVAKTVKAPILLQPAGNDEAILFPDGEIVNIIKGEAKQEATSTLYSDMAHGWVPRGDIADEKVQRDIKAALEEAAAFFKKHLA